MKSVLVSEGVQWAIRFLTRSRLWPGMTPSLALTVQSNLSQTAEPHFPSVGSGRHPGARNVRRFGGYELFHGFGIRQAGSWSDSRRGYAQVRIAFALPADLPYPAVPRF